MSDKKFFLFFSLLLALFTSCKWNNNNEGLYPGFDQSSSGAYFKRITIGDGQHLPSPGDSVYLKVLFQDSTGKVIFNSAEKDNRGVLGFFVAHPKPSSMFEEAFRTMTEGDSTAFIILADSLYKQSFNLYLPPGIKPGSNLRLFAQLMKIKTGPQIEFEQKQYRKWSEEMLATELEVLNLYLVEKKIKQQPDSNGIIVLDFKRGTGPSIFNFNSVLVHYKGTLLDGTLIDDSYSANQPLEYFSGNPGQMLKGLELTISRMGIGGKAKIILPSQLAFGKNGSGNGSVAPFASLIYELEILEQRN